MNSINDLTSDQDKSFEELDEQASQEIIGGADLTTKIRLPNNQFPVGGAGCPACLSGLDPRYNLKQPSEIQPLENLKY
jgi:hypothetical protein